MKTKEELNEMFTNNRGLVFSIVLPYVKYKNKGKEYEEDLFQVGFLALWKAVRRYDASKGFKFSTYAHSIVWGEVRRFYERFMLEQKRSDYNIPTVLSLNERVPSKKDCEDIDFVDLLIDDYTGYDLEALESRIIKLAESKESEIKHISAIIKLKVKGYSQAKITKILNLPNMKASRSIAKFREVVKREIGI